MKQLPTLPGGGSASDWRPATITISSAEPQGRWGGLDVFREPGVEALLPDNTQDGTPANDNDEDTQQNLSLQHRKTASLAQRAGQRPNAAVVLGVLSGLAAVGMAAPANRNNDPWIAVADAETLGKIGHDPDFPLNGNYRQTGDIDGSQLRQSIGDDTHPFTGQFRGEKGTISNLRNCLVKRVASEGRLDRLRFTDANIRSTGPTAVVACKISDKATVSNICVDNARVVVLGRYPHGGIAGGDVSGTVANIRAVNCNVVTLSPRSPGKAGIGAGKLTGGKVANTTAVNCTVAAFGSKGVSALGIGAGYLVDNGIVANTTAVNCKVVTPHGGLAAIGVGVIKAGTLANTTAVNCKVSTRSGGAGIGAGRLQGYTSRITNTTAVNCRVENAGADIYGHHGSGSAGIGAGTAQTFDTVAETTAVNCQVATSGENGDAGIGVGRASDYGAVANITAVNCTVATSGKGGRAGIGAGWVKHGMATVANTTAVNCNVVSSGPGGDAGIGAGLVKRNIASETIADTTALNCTVITSGNETKAGIGVGNIVSGGTVVRTTATNCQVDSLGEYSKAAVRGGRNPDICNVRIDGHRKNNTLHGCRSWLGNLCEGIDRRLLQSDCRFVFGDGDFAELIRNNTRQSELCAPTVIPPASSKSGPTMWGLSNASIAGIPTTHSPGKSGDSAASGLTNAAIIGIAFGGGLFLLIGVGWCIYRYCCHRASSRVADNHSVGQSQGGSNTEGGSDDLELHRRSLADPAEGDNHKVPLISTTRL